MSYDKKQAGVQMTLSTIAYADDKEDLPTIRSKIIAELKIGKYATKGEWELAWGPIIGTKNNNLVYIAKQGISYSLVLRGTSPTASGWLADMPTGKVPFSFAAGNVSSEFFQSFDGMLDVADTSGSTLTTYLQSIEQPQNKTFFVTGHSQGGGLTPMFVAWLDKLLNLRSTGYAFAPPTSGDPDFADWISNNATSYQVENPLDIVPFGYDRIQKIYDDEIPKKVEYRSFYHAAIETAVGLTYVTSPWKQPDTIIKLRKIQIPSSVEYTNQVADQHNYNSYLYLLGVEQTDIWEKSNLPKFDTENASS